MFIFTLEQSALEIILNNLQVQKAITLSMFQLLSAETKISKLFNAFKKINVKYVWEFAKFQHDDSDYIDFQHLPSVSTLDYLVTDFESILENLLRTKFCKIM